jgi:archaemetzincin
LNASASATRQNTKRRALWLLIGALCGGWVAFWLSAPPPAVGGGQPDSPVARWVKGRIYATVTPLDEAGYVRLTPQNANGWYGIFAEPIQSLEYYQARQPMRPTPQRRTVVLQPLGDMTAGQMAMLRDLQEYSQAFFQLPVRMAPPLSLEAAKQWTRPTTSRAGSPTGGTQYDASKLLSKVLLPRLPDDAAAYLGITMSDLWADDLSYVFGLGDVDHRVGVYSLCRYYPEFWGHQSTARDRTQTLRRACLVLNHEAGHMFGLMHCVLYKCSMNGSNSLADADQTPLDYCPVCHRKLLWNLGCDGIRRYEDLLRFYREHGLQAEAKWTEQRLQNWRRIAHP